MEFSFYVLGWILIVAHDFLDVLFRNSTRYQSGVLVRTILSTLVSLFLRKSVLWLAPEVATPVVFCVLVLHAVARLGFTLVARICGALFDAILNLYSLIIHRPSLTTSFSAPQLQTSGPPTKQRNDSAGKDAVLDESDAVRLALLICSCYERAAAQRRVREPTREGSSCTSEPSSNAATIGNTTGDAPSRKRRELLGLFYTLASSQLSRPGLAGSSPPVVVTPDSVQASANTMKREGKAPLASATSIHDLVVSASTPQGLELALSARISEPSAHDLPAHLTVPVPESSVPSSLRPGNLLPESEGVKLHEVTCDRDLFRTRAYQLAFKVDDLHNRHSQTLCALERAEAVIEGLRSDKRDAVVALASVLSTISSSRTQQSHTTSSSLSSMAFSPASVPGYPIASVPRSKAGFTSDARHLQADSYSETTLTAAMDDVVLYPRTPSGCCNTPASSGPTEPLLLPVDDAARSLTPGGDLDGSWRKRWASSPAKKHGQAQDSSTPAQIPSITKSLLGKLSWLRKGGRKREGDNDCYDATSGDEVEAAKMLRPLPSSWLPATSDAGLDCALEPELGLGDAADDDGLETLGGSEAELGKDLEASTLQGTHHGGATDGWNSSATLPPPDDNWSGSRRHSWVPRETISQSADSPTWRHGPSTFETFTSSGKARGPDLAVRSQRSTASLNSYGRNGTGRARTSTGPPQMFSEASSNWRDRERADGLEEILLSSGTSKTSRHKAERRSFGFGAGTTRADEMRRQNAPYFQGFQGQGQGQPLRRSQSTIGSEVRSSTDGLDGDLRRRSSLAEKLRTGGVASTVMDNVWNRRAQERAAAALVESVQRVRQR